MKRAIAVFAAAIMLAITVFGGTAMAAEKEDLVGEWTMRSMIQSGIEIDASTLSAMGMTATLTLNEDGTAALAMTGQDPQEGTWSFEDSTISFGADIQFTLEDDTLVVSNEGQSMVFGKGAAEAVDVTLAPAVTDAEISDFEGTWNADTYVAFGIPMPVAMGGIEITLTIADGKAHVIENMLDMNNNFEVSETIEMDFEVEMKDGGVLYVDFNGEDILSPIGLSAEGIDLTLHEDGKLSGTVPSMQEALASLAELSETVENTAAEEAEAAPAEEAAEDTEGSSDSDSASMSLEMYLILEKAE